MKVYLNDDKTHVDLQPHNAHRSILIGEGTNTI